MNKFFCAAALAFLTGLQIHAVTITNLPVADTTLHEGFPTNNAGALAQINVGRTGQNAFSGRVRGLLKFDLAGKIPTNATISAVRLRFNVLRFGPAGGAPMTFELRRVLQSWTEGSKAGSSAGDGAALGEATWSHRHFDTNAWATAGASGGADRSPQVSASVQTSGVGVFTFNSSPALVADIEAWLSNTNSNFGWIMQAADEITLNTARAIASRESTTPPTLEIDYNLPAAAELRIDSITRGPTGVTLTWSGGTPPYQISAATNLLGPWNFISSPSPATNALVSTPAVNTFYRVAGN